MSGGNKISTKRAHPKTRFTFPDDLEIPESALQDRKYLLSYVHILNDPRVYKRRRLNGDRTSSRFCADNNYHIKVVYNEPVIKRKSILANTGSPKAKNPDDSGTRKSVSFLSKITFIDSIDLDGASSDWTDIDVDDTVEKTKLKTAKAKVSKNKKLGNKEAAASNNAPSCKNQKKKAKNKPLNKNGHKVKSAVKDLFKFKITKSLSIKSRKFGRSKDKKMKQLQKKFGKRMFKAFVNVKKSFNPMTKPDKVPVPSEKITSKANSETASVKRAASTHDCLLGQMSKKVKLSLSPVQGNTGDTNTEETTSGADITDRNLIESSSSEIIENSSNTENVGQINNPLDSRESIENHKTISEPETNHDAPSTESSHSVQPNEIHGDLESGEIKDSPRRDVTIVQSCNNTEPSPEVVESNPLPNVIDKITYNMYYKKNKDDVTVNGKKLESSNDYHNDLVDNVSTFNVSFSTKSIADNILSRDSSEITSIQFQLND